MMTLLQSLHCNLVMQAITLHSTLHLDNGSYLGPLRGRKCQSSKHEQIEQLHEYVLYLHETKENQ